jgi:hypothetical protein
VAQRREAAAVAQRREAAAVAQRREAAAVAPPTAGQRHGGPGTAAAGRWCRSHEKKRRSGQYFDSRNVSDARASESPGSSGVTTTSYL